MSEEPEEVSNTALALDHLKAIKAMFADLNTAMQSPFQGLRMLVHIYDHVEEAIRLLGGQP